MNNSMKSSVSVVLAQRLYLVLIMVSELDFLGLKFEYIVISR